MIDDSEIESARRARLAEYTARLENLLDEFRRVLSPLEINRMLINVLNRLAIELTLDEWKDASDKMKYHLPPRDEMAERALNDAIDTMVEELRRRYSKTE